MTQRAANKHFTGFDRGCQLQNRYDFQLSTVEGLVIFRIVVYKTPPPLGQRIRWYAIDPVIVAVRRRFIGYGIDETEQIPRPSRCLQRQYTLDASLLQLLSTAASRKKVFQLLKFLV
jgi:hypothetical protein